MIGIKVEVEEGQAGFASFSSAGRMRSLVIRFLSRFMTMKRLP
jgi:hypothetical protein